MHLTRPQDQKPEALESFYEERSQSNEAGERAIGKTMLALIARLRALPDERRVYGMTSHHRLCLLAENTFQSPWFVTICGSNGYYFIEYLMPKNVAPWPNASVRGEAQSEDEAVTMILTAMDKSEGWNKQ